MVLKTESSPGLNSIEYLAVCIKTTHPATDQRHTGFLYREDDQLKLLHLKFHFRKEDRDYATMDSFEKNYAWVTCDLEPWVQEQLAAYLSQAGQDPVMVPFGFSPPEGSFEAGTGRYLRVKDGEGLTCATFVLAILHAASLPLLNPRRWPERHTDSEWRDKIIGWLMGEMANPNEGFRPSPDHIEAVINAKKGNRFRPEEVAGAFAEPNEYWPLAAPIAIPLGEDVVAELNALGL